MNVLVCINKKYTPIHDNNIVSPKSLLPSRNISRFLIDKLSEMEFTWVTYEGEVCDGKWNINGLAQDCSDSNANALELLQSYTKLSTCSWLKK